MSSSTRCVQDPAFLFALGHVATRWRQGSGGGGFELVHRTHFALAWPNHLFRPTMITTFLVHCYWIWNQE
jgi:hypothetical protein